MRNELTDALYLVPPSAFTAARNAQVAQAKNAGDRTLAAELGALKRPSQSAWLVNLVARRRPEAVEALIALGRTIRDAQGSVTPHQLRDLSAQRRAELDRTLALVRDLAAEAGEAAPAKAQLAEAESTLAAAMADPEAAELVRAGRLLKALTYSGFGMSAGPADSGLGTLASGPARAAGGGAGTAGSSNARSSTGTRDGADQDGAAVEAAAAARLAAAQERLDEAGRMHAAAVAAETELQQQSEALTAELAGLSARLDALSRDARAARQARLAAERDLASAQRRRDRLNP